ncbi:hypothetical protein TNCV_2532961 [Trichonephila clavipes]|nr:hypothetical protein TNCV_2532961 [Trichonephila clavipes]
MQQGSRYLRKMAAQVRNREATVLHPELPHEVNKFIINEGRSLIELFLMEMTFEKLPTPVTHHLLTHDARPQLTIGAVFCALKNLFTDRASPVAGELPFHTTAIMLLTRGGTCPAGI